MGCTRDPRRSRGSLIPAGLVSADPPFQRKRKYGGALRSPRRSHLHLHHTGLRDRGGRGRHAPPEERGSVLYFTGMPEGVFREVYVRVYQ